MNYKEFKQYVDKTNKSIADKLKDNEEELAFYINLVKRFNDICDKKEELKKQQKEFINYLENIIQKEQKDLDDLCDIYKVPKENNSTYKFLCSFVHRIEEILSKYKKVIGDDK